MASEHRESSAIQAIKQLKARYFRLMDTKQWDEWQWVFTEDAWLKWGTEDDQVFEGREAIVAGVSASLKGAVTVHHGHMPEIEILSEDSARGIWAMYDWVDAPAFGLHGFGHYHEEYRCEEGVWRIARLLLTRLRVDQVAKG